MPLSLTKRVERVEQLQIEHAASDADQFARLTTAISDLGVKLGAQIDNVTSSLQTQIDEMTRVRIRAEGEAAGHARAVAEASAAAATPVWWHPWARWAVGGVVTGAIALIAVLASTIWDLEQAKIAGLQNRPAATVTINRGAPAN